MQASSAIALVNNIVFAPGWRFIPEDNCHRFEGSIRLTIFYPAVQTNRDKAEDGYLDTMDGCAAYIVQVDDCDCDEDLYRKLLTDCIFDIWHHESREMLRVKPTFWAPFHPHKTDGMRKWGHPQHDLAFGVG